MSPEHYGNWIKTYYDGKERWYKFDDPRFLSDLKGTSRQAFWSFKDGYHNKKAHGAIERSIHSGSYNLGFGPPHNRRWIETDDPIKMIKQELDNGKQGGNQ